MANKSIKIDNRIIGKGEIPFFIAEVGINHNGEIQIAKKLIDAAFATNWDCVKFQKRTPEICVPEHQKYLIKETPKGKETYIEYKLRMEFGESEYNLIDNYCKQKPILWSASVWDIPSIDFLLQYNPPFIKIPSAKLTEKDILIHAAKSNVLVILSTGMSDYSEIDEAVNILEKYATGNFILMYTNSTYPTPHEDINLRIINLMEERYDCLIGYSGHEYDLEPTVYACVLGVPIIERHITLSHTMWGSDHAASLEVHGMDILRKRIKDINIILGNGIKKLSEKELEIRKKLRGK